MEKRPELGEFLRSRRSRLRPEDAGLVHYGGRRRVPGLRREELAQLAGVSVAYYTRLEQGQSQNASDAVLDAIARALGLDDAERAYLRDLARPAGATRRRARPERVRPGVRRMIESFGAAPALVLGRGTDVLVWNATAHALLAGHVRADAPDRPNLARLLFLDAHTRELYADWNKKTRDSVAYLRLAASRYPDDPRLTELIGELTMKSRRFATLWSAHPVGDCGYATRTYRHPLVGTLTLSEEVMPLPDDPGQRVQVFHAEAGSPSEAALRLLADLTERDPLPARAEAV